MGAFIYTGAARPIALPPLSHRPCHPQANSVGAAPVPYAVPCLVVGESPYLGDWREDGAFRQREEETAAPYFGGFEGA